MFAKRNVNKRHNNINNKTQLSEFMQGNNIIPEDIELENNNNENNLELKLKENPSADKDNTSKEISNANINKEISFIKDQIEEDSGTVNNRKKNNKGNNLISKHQSINKSSSLNNNIPKDSLFKELQYSSNVELQNFNDACKEEEIYTEASKDAISKTKRQIELTKSIQEGTLDPKLYRGKDGYAKYLTKSEQDLNNSKYTGSLGPMRVNTNIKSISQIDYAMGICKDFKNAGVCGFGDDCIFLHERGEIKSSWEIDKELKKKEMRKLELIKKGINPSSYDTNTKNDFSLTKLNQLEKETNCGICGKECINPVITLCEHVFCESCALQYYNNKSKLCYVCSKHLKGVFNNASSIQVKINIKKELMEKKKENEVI